MKTKNSLLGVAATAAALALSFFTADASAIAVTCGQFTLDPALSCQGATGGDRVEGEADLAGLFPPGPWTYVDKDEDSLSVPVPASPWAENAYFLTNSTFGAVNYGGDRSGYFFISSALASAYDSFLVVLKGGNLDPRYAAFKIDVPNLLTGTGNFSGYLYGTWTTASNALSHSSLYRGAAVPEPATLALFGLGLIGIGFARRRKA